MNPKNRFCFKASLVLFLFMFCALTFIGCGQGSKQQNQGGVDTKRVVKIGTQPGFGFASLTLIDELDLMKKYLPDVDIEYVLMTSGTPLTEMLVTKEIQIAQMGTAPFLIAWDKDVPIKLIGTGMAYPMEVVTWREDINSLDDISPEDRIALPSLRSGQYLAFAKACADKFGDANKYDGNLVAMGHPDAFAALKTKREIIGHYATPPELFEELALEGYHSITSNMEAFGQNNYSNLVVSTEFYEENPDIVEAFLEALDECHAIFRDNPEKASEVLAPILKYDYEKTLKYFTWEGMEFTRKLSGTMDLAAFMYEVGFIDKMPQSLDDLAIKGTPGD